MFFLIIILEGEGERERQTDREKKDIDVRKKHQSVATRMCPGQGLNPQPTYVP